MEQRWEIRRLRMAKARAARLAEKARRESEIQEVTDDTVIDVDAVESDFAGDGDATNQL
jgi:hypothetical protein